MEAAADDAERGGDADDDCRDAVITISVAYGHQGTADRRRVQRDRSLGLIGLP